MLQSDVSRSWRLQFKGSSLTRLAKLCWWLARAFNSSPCESVDGAARESLQSGGRLPQRERPKRWKIQCLLWPSLGIHTPSLPPHSIGHPEPALIQCARELTRTWIRRGRNHHRLSCILVTTYRHWDLNPGLSDVKVLVPHCAALAKQPLESVDPSKCNVTFSLQQYRMDKVVILSML